MFLQLGRWAGEQRAGPWALPAHTLRLYGWARGAVGQQDPQWGMWVTCLTLPLSGNFPPHGCARLAGPSPPALPAHHVESLAAMPAVGDWGGHFPHLPWMIVDTLTASCGKGQLIQGWGVGVGAAHGHKVPGDCDPEDEESHIPNLSLSQGPFPNFWEKEQGSSPRGTHPVPGAHQGPPHGPARVWTSLGGPRVSRSPPTWLAPSPLCHPSLR